MPTSDLPKTRERLERLHAMSDSEIRQDIHLHRWRIFTIRRRQLSVPVTNVREIRFHRKEIARCLTILGQREIVDKLLRRAWSTGEPHNSTKERVAVEKGMGTTVKYEVSHPPVTKSNFKEVTARQANSQDVVIYGTIYEDYYSLCWETNSELHEFIALAANLASQNRGLTANTVDKEFDGILIATPSNPEKRFGGLKLLFEVSPATLATDILKEQPYAIRIATNVGDVWYDIRVPKGTSRKAGILSHEDIIPQVTEFCAGSVPTNKRKGLSKDVIADCLKDFVPT